MNEKIVQEVADVEKGDQVQYTLKHVYFVILLCFICVYTQLRCVQTDASQVAHESQISSIVWYILKSPIQQQNGVIITGAVWGPMVTTLGHLSQLSLFT